MPNRRMIDASIWMNEDLAALDYRRRLLFIGLFSNADDQGRLRGHPALIGSKIFPYETIPLDEIDAALQDLSEKGFIIRYQADGKAHIQMTAWWIHQRLQWAKPSELPAPDGWQDRIRVRRGTGVWTQGWPNVQDHNPADKIPVETPEKIPIETPEPITRTGTGTRIPNIKQQPAREKPAIDPKLEEPEHPPERKALLFQLISDSGGIVGSPTQGQQWLHVLELTNNDDLIRAAFQHVKENGKYPNRGYVEQIIASCEREGRMPGDEFKQIKARASPTDAYIDPDAPMSAAAQAHIDRQLKEFNASQRQSDGILETAH